MKRKQGSTIFLKVVLFLLGITVLALCIFGLPGIASRDAEANPETAYLQYPFLVCAYVLFTPFFFALYQAFKLLAYIDRNKSFSELSVRSLRYIKYCAITISILIVLGIIFVAIFIEGDRTGVIMLGLIGTFASSVIATFTAVLQKLLKEAIKIKSENELTV
jgi:hypothetical protein